MSSFILLVIFTVALAEVVAFQGPALNKRNFGSLPRFAAGANDELDSFRSMLETSWDSDTMGQVPSDAAISAKEAYTSILTASDDGVGVFFIDLLLPAYDITQGSNLYDEVVALEYCIALSECLTGKTSILVRDEKILETCTRVLDAREREMQAATTEASEEIDEEEDDDDEDTEDELDSDVSELEEEGVSVEEPRKAPDVDSFRQQLMTSWEAGNETTVSDEIKEPKPEKEKPTYAPTEKRYRLASMFGNARISGGADMVETVVKALRQFALPTDDEENLIVLSAVNREEMVAVRSLVAKYDGQKKIILVNCKLDPIPRELFGAETVYSLLPLIAKPKDGDQQSGDSAAPKIVILRRYPGDWEVFVDTGKGFKLAKRAPVDLRNKRGPPLEWIGNAVQKYLESQ